MKSRCLYAIILAASSPVIFSSCDRPGGIACTEEFRFITIEVDGPILEDHYTIRLSNGDTIRPLDQGFPTGTSYVVLDDNYSNELRNKEENFRFQGILSSQVVVSEDFVIGADECHIYYVSGKTEVTLEVE